jgi:heme exporter protein B
MGPPGYSTLLIALVLGTPTLSLVGAIGAALILGARRSGVLLSVLILPLFIPILIFGVSAVDAALTNLSSKPPLLILGALFLTALVLCPWASAAALRQAAE